MCFKIAPGLYLMTPCARSRREHVSRQAPRGHNDLKKRHLSTGMDRVERLSGGSGSQSESLLLLFAVGYLWGGLIGAAPEAQRPGESRDRLPVWFTARQRSQGSSGCGDIIQITICSVERDHGLFPYTQERSGGVVSAQTCCCVLSHYIITCMWIHVNAQETIINT